MQLTLTSKVKKNSRLITKKLGRETIILDPATGEIRRLNETASLIWRALKPTTTVNEIIEIICQKFEASTRRVHKDVFIFLEKYLKDDLIKLLN